MPQGTATERTGELGVFGASAVEERFRQTLARGRLASTYLFVGPGGVGKRLFALRLARALLCLEPDGLRACGRCDSCRLDSAGTHPDLLQVAKPEGKSTLPLELFLGKPDARGRSGLCHDLALRPLVGTRRVAVIDDADHFSIESANCLLKTLEEPPPHSVLFLVGTSLARQLPTIRSRSQVVRFAPLAEEEVAAILQGAPHHMPPEEASLLAAASGGSVAGALAANDEGRRDAVEAVVACLAAPQLDPIRLAKALEEGAKGAGAEASARRQRMHDLLAAMIGRYRAGLRQAATGAESDGLLDALEVCLDAEEALGRNANQSALIQWLVCSLARIG